MIAGTERPAAASRLQAESLGHKFIELRLNPQYVRGGAPEVRYHGVMIAKVFPDGIDNSGLPRTSVEVTGGQIIFELDVDRRMWTGWLLDDETEGVIKNKAGTIEKGYNRDFLAMDQEDAKFQILDLDIKADVFRRYERYLGKDSNQVKPKTDLDAAYAKIAKLENANTNTEEKYQKILANKAMRRVDKKEKTSELEELNKKDLENADNKKNGDSSTVSSKQLEPS